MKLIIAGGRDYRLTPADKARLNRIPGVTEVVSGCARGVDTDGEAWAAARGLPVRRFPADWDGLGRKAGVLRNTQMAEYADAVALFRGGKGTDNMRQQAIDRGLLVFDFALSVDEWWMLFDKAEQALERIALMLQDIRNSTQETGRWAAVNTWFDCGLSGEPSEIQLCALLSGDERLAAAAVRRYVR